VRWLPIKPAPPVISIFIITLAPVVYGSGRNFFIHINRRFRGKSVVCLIKKVIREVLDFEGWMLDECIASRWDF